MAEFDDIKSEYTDFIHVLYTRQHYQEASLYAFVAAFRMRKPSSSY